MLTSLAEREPWLAALQMQTRIHCSFGTRSALQTVLVALQLCVVALQLLFVAHLLFALTLYLSVLGMRSAGLHNDLNYGYIWSKLCIVATMMESNVSTQTSRRHF
jgi:hypothetical protein